MAQQQQVNAVAKAMYVVCTSSLYDFRLEAWELFEKEISHIHSPIL